MRHAKAIADLIVAPLVVKLTVVMR